MNYQVIIEYGDSNLSAFVPDLPGCVATGANLRELRLRMQKAVILHLEGMVEDGQPIPKPKTHSFSVSSPTVRRPLVPKAPLFSAKKTLKKPTLRKQKTAAPNPALEK